MNKSKLDLPHVKLLIAHSLAAGSSHREIAELLGTSQPTISRHAKRDDVRELVQKEGRLLVAQVESIIEEIEKDPRFISEFQKRIERRLFRGI